MLKVYILLNYNKRNIIGTPNHVWVNLSKVRLCQLVSLLYTNVSNYNLHPFLIWRCAYCISLLVCIMVVLFYILLSTFVDFADIMFIQNTNEQFHLDLIFLGLSK